MNDLIVIEKALTVQGVSPAARELKGEIIRQATHKNPKWQEAKRLGRYCFNIPSEIKTFMKAPDGSIVCGRGFLNLVREYEDRIQTVDARLLPDLAKPITFTGELRDYQSAVVTKAINAEQGVLVAPTGSGKTVIGCAIMAAVKTPTLFLVHRVELLEQSVAAVRRFLGVEPGVVGNGKFNVQDITIAMVQSLKADRLKELTNRFGCVILDEAHHAPASTFGNLINKFPAKYRFGLTATPSRKDRMHPILFDLVGPIVAKVNTRKLIADGAITSLEVVIVDSGFTGKAPRQCPKKDEKAEDAPIDFGRLLEQLVRNQSRNRKIVDTVAELFRGQSLVLTDRIEHVSELVRLIRLTSPDLLTFGLTSETPKDERAAVIRQFRDGSASVLVATCSLIGEGFDCPAIDSVFLTTPTGNPNKVKQLIGRALRPAPDKVSGRVVDFVDNIDVLSNMAWKRAEIYRSFRPVEEGLL